MSLSPPLLFPAVELWSFGWYVSNWLQRLLLCCLMWTLGIHIMICSDIRSTVISFVDQICKPGRVRTMTLFASARFASHLVIVVVWVNLKSAYQNTSRVTWSANLVPHVPSTMKSLEVGLQGSVTPSWHQYSVLTDCMLSHWTFTFCREIRCPI